MTPATDADKVFPITTFISDLPSSLTPQLVSSAENDQGSSTRRLVIVGDVHGMKRSLEALLEKVSFDKDKGDHLVLVGDLINKGPDSPGVIDLVMELGATAVRGNHDNAVLDAAVEVNARGDSSMHAGSVSSGTAQLPGNSGVDSPSETLASDGPEKGAPLEGSLHTRHSETTYSTARALSAPQLDWLAALPLILRIKLPYHPASSLNETLIVVHAGLTPGVPLEKQDPHAVMHMRSVTHPPGDEGTFVPAEASGEEGWATHWDQWQDQLTTRTTVIFGHDAKRGLQLGSHSIGLDSACLYGYSLSALVVESTDTGFQHRVVQVKCADTPVAPTA
ncbi:aflYe/ orf/ Ser -Thr protein phosphatase family protein [Aspergillus nomiae NRRL 13137]|uniref:AflYe/ orf/ Ser-Thr protein phosphatase family protein n=1 Tax=Aspergillus nomiae NRRL (strain ATCC 15546 / NRRL 13137 / CBS 260.88 / M93) TaxID=1509407 RepID=A0A0L1JIZ7_ASPN3|nr:aflYe/ orf/ Ser -Thr protein phosphatase family protein [Aspergillus nomiae NRRL 13137]KNG91682.1 aflYe/ orf/ Ser -Thr protein phosphatase family protein [Aspergillus nomiae NRRL 13137]